MAEKSDRENLSILAIVAFVGAVSIFIILIHFSKINLSSDLSGQAITVIPSKVMSSTSILLTSMSIDSDSDGIVNGIETKIGTKYLIDDLSDDLELDFDIDKFYISGSTITDGIVSGSITGRMTIPSVSDASYGRYLNMQDTRNDDYIVFFEDGSFSGSYSFIIYARVKPASPDTLGIKTLVIDPTTTCGYPHFSLDTYQGEYRIAVNLDDSLVSAVGGTVSSGQWQEVVGIYSDNKEMLYLFVDGTLVAEEIASGAGRQSLSKPLYVGSGDPECDEDRDFEGSIDFLKIYGYYLR